MTFGKAHDIWSRVVGGDKTLTKDEVKVAAKWFDGFIDKLQDKANQTKQKLEDEIQTQEKDAIEKMSGAAESDQRQLYDFIRKYDDLVNWLKRES